jgi:hypothetical protein
MKQRVREGLGELVVNYRLQQANCSLKQLFLTLWNWDFHVQRYIEF